MLSRRHAPSPGLPYRVRGLRRTWNRLLVPEGLLRPSLVVETRVLDDDASKVVLAEDEEVIEQLSAQRARQGPSVPGEEIGSALGSCTPDLVMGPIVLDSAAVTSRAHDPDCHRWVVHIGAFDARPCRIEFWPTTRARPG